MHVFVSARSYGTFYSNISSTLISPYPLLSFLFLYSSSFSYFFHQALAVREAAYSALVAVVRATNPRAARLVLPLFFTALEHPDW